MAYTINYAGPSGANAFTIADGTLNIQSTPLNLPGRNYAGYGQPVNQGLVDTIQNFARADANGPPNPLVGQLWFNDSNPGNTTSGSANSLTALRVNYSNTSSPNWKIVAINDANANVLFNNINVNGNIVGAANVNYLVGNWNVPEGSNFALASGGNANFLGSDLLANLISSGGTSANGNLIGQWYVNPNSSIILGNGAFINTSNGNLISTTLLAGNSASVSGNILGNWTLTPGSRLNLSNSGIYLEPGTISNVDFRTNDTGISTGDKFFANNIRSGNALTDVANLYGNWVVTTGSNIFLSSGATANFLSGLLLSNTLDAGSNTAVGNLVGNWVLSSGSAIDTRNGILYSDILTTGDAATVGELTGTWGMTAGSSLNLAANSAVLYANRINSGGLGVSGEITGQWTLVGNSTIQATYADLGERFAADAVYEAGTVVELGGSAEVTAVREELSTRVFGVISENAGYIMNGGAGSNDTHPIIAMTGRVPVKVKGSVRKFDRLVSAGNGYARSAIDEEVTATNVVGRALEDKTTDEPGKVLATVSVNI